MKTIDLFYNLALLVVMVAGLISVLYTLPKVKPWWRPVYVMKVVLAALPIAMVLLVLFTGKPIRDTFLIVLLKSWAFLSGVVLIASPWTHRLEQEFLGNNGNGKK